MISSKFNIILAIYTLFPAYYANFCHVGQYYNSSLNACGSCDPSCETCTGPLQNQCLSCIPGLKLNGSWCLCNYNQYFDIQPQLCKNCHVSCSLTCSGPSLKNCVSCLSNEFNYQNACFPRCLSSEYFDQNSLSCQPCAKNCSVCIGPGLNECSSCLPQFVLYKGKCLDNCPESFYADTDGVCKPCHDTCLECFGPSANECLKCYSNSSLAENSCIIASNATNTGIIKAYAKSTIDSNKFLIYFDRDISEYYTFLNSKLNVSMMFHDRQPPIKYNYSISLLGTNTELSIQLAINDYLLPSNVLSLTLPDFIKKGQERIPIQGIHFYFFLQEYYPYTSSNEKIVAVSSELVKTTSKINDLYSLFSSSIFKSIHSIRSGLIDSMLNLFIFMNVYFPPNFVNFAKGNLDGYKNIIPNFYTKLIPSNQIEASTDSGNIRVIYSDDSNIIEQPVFDLYLPTKFFFINFGSNLSLFVIILTFTFFWETLTSLLKGIKDHSLIQKFSIFVSMTFRWNLILNEMLSNYQLITFFAVLGVYNQSQVIIDKVGSGIVLSLAVIGLVICFRFSKKVLLHYAKFHQLSSKINCPDCEMAGFFKRIQILHNSLKADRFLNLMFFNILMIRSLIFPFVLIFLMTFPSLQLAYLLITSVVVICYLIKFNPIKKRFQQILTLLYELMLLISIAVAIVLHIYNHIHIEDIDNRSKMGFMMISTSLGMSLLNLASIVFELYGLAQTLFRKNRVQPLQIKNDRPSVPQVSSDREERIELPGTCSNLVPTSLKLVYSNTKIEIGSDSSVVDNINKRKSLKDIFIPSHDINYDFQLQEEVDFLKRKKSLSNLRKSFKLNCTNVSSINCFLDYNKSQNLQESQPNLELGQNNMRNVNRIYFEERTLENTYAKNMPKITVSP